MLSDPLRDFSSALERWRLWSLLGWLDIRQRYARSALGPFWITLSMGVMVGSLGLVYGTAVVVTDLAAMRGIGHEHSAAAIA